MRSSLILAIAVLACAAGVVAWHLLDTRPPLPGEAERLRASLRYFHDLECPIGERLALLAFAQSESHPPMLCLATLPLYVIGGTGTAVAGMVQIPFLAIMLLSVYGIGRRLYSAHIGALAALILSCSPVIIGFSRLYLPDIPEVAMLCLATYAALRTEGFWNKSWCSALGVVLGMGMLTTARFALFIAPVALYLFFSSRGTLLSAVSGRQKYWNLLFVIIPAALISAPWYIFCLWALSPLTARGFRGALAAVSPSLLLSLPRVLLESIYPPMAVLLILGLALSVWKRSASLLLLLWLLVPIALLVVFSGEAPHSVIAAIPPSSLIIAAGLYTIPHKIIRRVCISAACALAIVSFAALTFPVPWERVAVSLRIPSIIRMYASRAARSACGISQELSDVAIGPPRRESWDIETMLSDIVSLSGERQDRKVPTAWSITPHTRFNRFSLRYTMEKGNYPIELVKPDKAQFILTRFVTDEQRTKFDAWCHAGRQVRMVKTYPLPDGSEAELYTVPAIRRVRHSAFGLPRETGEEKVSDADAQGGWARFADREKAAPGELARSPRQEMERGAYQFSMRLKYNRLTGDMPIARVTIVGAEEDMPLATREILAREFGEANSYGSARFDFAIPERGPLECRIFWTGASDLWIDSIEVYPIAGTQ
ncbi:MAG: glycosyltransferase family 39 protein [Candidatus Aureabacteria bacterium]|nr:glycosyltransferase family 39 protein [Candidatus Auribacterota bacterium]